MATAYFEQYIGGNSLEIIRDVWALATGQSGNSTQLVITSIVSSGTLITIINGSGFTFDGSGQITGGTISEISVAYDTGSGPEEILFFGSSDAGGLNLDFLTLSAAIQASLGGDNAPYFAILDNYDITFDASTVTHPDGVQFYSGGGEDTHTGSAGNDVFAGLGGDDSLDGGNGIDAAVYGGVLSPSAITSDGSAWYVDADVEGFDTLENIEVVAASDGPDAGTGIDYFLLVGAGGFNTLAEAVAIARDGDTIILSSGSIAIGGPSGDHLIIDKSLTILGAQSGTVANDPSRGGAGESYLLGGLHILGDNVVIDGIQTGDGIIVDGDGVEIRNSIVDRPFHDGKTHDGSGIYVRGNDVTIDGNFVSGWTTGLYLVYGPNFSVVNNTFDDNRTAFAFTNLSGGDPSASLVSGNVFTNSLNDAHVSVHANLADYDASAYFDDTNVFDSSTAEVRFLMRDGGIGGTITGTAHNDNYIGQLWGATSGDEEFYGLGGDDSFLGDAGDDAFDGGAGVDTAIYLGARTNYTIDFAAGTVTDNVGDEGTDTLTNVEFLEFSDGVIAWEGSAFEGESSGYDYLGTEAADMLLQNGSGHTFVLSDGGTGARADLGGAGQDWQLVARGDLEGGPRDEMVFQNASGNVLLVREDGAGSLELVSLGGAGRDWTVLGAGQFDASGDGKVLVQNSSGHTFLIGESSRVDFAGTGQGWTPVAFADVDGSGYDDLVFQNANGATFAYLDGTTARVELMAPPGGWNVLAVADFNGDGTESLLAESNGRLFLSDADGRTYLGGHSGNPWSVAAVGDFDGDDAVEILVQNQSGYLFNLADNGSVRSETGGAGQGWQVMAVADADNDGAQDVLIRNANDYMFMLHGADPANRSEVGMLHNNAQLIATGDFDGSGGDDFIMQRGSGGVFVLTDGGSGRLELGGDGQGWELRELADFDMDGSDDMLLQNAAGHMFLIGDAGGSRTDFGPSSAQGWDYLSVDQIGDTDNTLLLV